MEFSVNRIGILDPQEKLVGRLRQALLHRGFLADLIHSPEAMEAYCLRLRPSGLLLDLSDFLPGAAAWIKGLRNAGFVAPTIVFLSTDSDSHSVELLVAGANDILPTAEDTTEILGRLDFIFARYTAAHQPTLTQNFEERFYEALTRTEQRILEELKANAPKPVSRDALTWAVSRRSVSPDERSLDVHVSSIRRKIKLTKAPLAIETVRGVGFLYKKEGSFCAQGANHVARRRSA